MTSLKRILKDFRETGSFSALVNVHAAIGENLFCTKSGNVLAVLRVQGTDAECLDLEEVDRLCRLLESTLRNLDEHFRVYQHVLKRRYGAIPSDVVGTSAGNPVVQEAVTSRTAYLAAKAGELYRIETYFTVVYEGESHEQSFSDRLRTILTQPITGSRELLSDKAQMLALQARLAHACQILCTKIQGLVVQLEGTVKVEWLGKQEAFRFLRSLLNFAPHKVDGVRLKYNAHVDYQVCGSSLECYRDHLRLDNYHAQVLTLKEPPSRTSADMLKDLLKIPAEFIVASEWKRVNNHRMRSFIQSGRRHYHNSKRSFVSYLNTSPNGPQDALVDDGANSIVDELGRTLAELDVGGNHFGLFAMTIICYAEDRAILRRAVAECHRVFATHDAQLLDERFNLQNAYLAVVPGNDAYNLRSLYLSSRNVADLAFLFAPQVGHMRNDHLGTEYLSVFETRGGTPYFFNLHAGDVGHTLVLGSTGSGKSFLLNFILTFLQKYQPLIYVFDIGGSYEHLTRLVGGTYVPVGLEGRTFRINPFSLVPTPENLRFLFSFVRVLLESSGTTLSTAEEKDLFAQIENLYAIGPEERRLRTLANVLPRRLRAELEKWVEGGPYGGVFDNAEDNLTLAEFQTFDLEGMSKAPQVLEALLFYVFHRANSAIYDSDSLTRLKIFVMDEAWRFFKHPTIKAYIVEALKTWRKKNAAMIVATQSADDLLQSEMLSVVEESCATKLFLANPGMNQTSYREAFHLNATEGDLIASLAPKQEILIKRPDGSKVVKLNVDKKGYWLYTSNPFDHRKRQEAIERHGFHRALELLAEEKP